jgi:lipoprotein-releasing system permease protein
LHFLFAWRYFKAKKSTNAINFIAWISIVAMAIGTFALILVLSVFNGFEDLVKSLYSSFYSDLKVLPEKGKNITITPEQIAKLKTVKGIRNFSLVIEEKGVLQNGDYQSIIFLKGVDENYQYVSGVSANLVKGEYDLGTEESPKLLLGSGLEGAIGVQADKNVFVLQIILPKKTGGTEQFDEMNSVSIDSIGTSSSFKIQQEFDNKYGITNIAFTRKALALPENVYSAVEVSLIDPATAEDIKPAVEKIFGKGSKVQTLYQQNQTLYSVMNNERWAIYGVLCLILVVAAFNMVGALTMLVLEKRKDIGVLHALGGNKKFIQKIFLGEGFLLAGLGTVIGMFLAFTVAVLQLKYHLIPLGGDSFLIDYFPVKMRVTDFLLVGATVFVIALIASWLPSMKAAGAQFSLRSEQD